MIRLLAIAGALGLCTTASATEIGGSFSLELARIANTDRSWNLFSENDGMPSRGLRAGVKIGPLVTVQGGWHRVSRGASVSVPVADGLDFRTQEVQMAFFADEFTLGGQFGVPIKDIVVPYASVDGMLMRGTMKLDEDPDTRKNPGQYVAHGLNPGVVTSGGMELRSPESPAGWLAAVFFEAGHSWFLSGDFDDFGEMRPGGFTVRGGAGIRF